LRLGSSDWKVGTRAAYLNRRGYAETMARCFVVAVTIEARVLGRRSILQCRAGPVVRANELASTKVEPYTRQKHSVDR